MSTQLERLTADLQAINTRRQQLAPLRDHWQGRPRAAYLSEESRKALDGRLARLSVNMPRVLVKSYTDRLQITGFTDDNGNPAPDTWKRYLAGHLQARADLLHSTRLMYGESYLTIWPRPGAPLVVVDSPLSMTTERDAETGNVIRATRVWRQGNHAHAMTVTADKLTYWESNTSDLGGSGTWKHSRTEDTPYSADGLVPVVPFTRYVDTDDYEGTPLIADVLDLTDALNKVVGDALVTSEDYARPRRWATGLELEYDDDDQPVDPFAKGRMMQSEAPDTKFGQFDPARLDSYADMIATLTQLIGAVTGLPPHYLGLHGDQPASAEGAKTAESQLVQHVYAEQRQLNRPWTAAAELLDLAGDLSVTAPPARRPVWESPEIRTPAQAADAAAKLQGMGIPLDMILAEPLNWTPERIAKVKDSERQNAITDIARSFNRGR